MKYKIFSIFAILTILICVGCSNSSNSEDKERIAQLEAEIAQLQSQSNNQQTSSTNSGISSSDNSSTYSSSRRQKNNPSQFVGTYEIVDEIGHTWVIKLNSDETATMGLKGENKVAYASWELINFLDYNPGLEFDDERAIVYFPSGEEKPYLPCIIDGYFYLDSSAGQAKNPRKRLPIKKVN